MNWPQSIPKNLARGGGERGVTFVFIAMTIFIILSMAALAIDVATLYAARSDAQRAADAAALGAARALVASGFTSDTPTGVLATPATSMAQQIVNAILQQNPISGQTGTLAQPITFTLTPAGNPQVTVIVQRRSLPSFFSRIWSGSSPGVTARATAEAYNPSGRSANPAVSVQCVKPFVVPNQDPDAAHGNVAFVDATTGALNKPGLYPNGIVGEFISFLADCDPDVPGQCTLRDSAPVANPEWNGNSDFNGLEYVPASVTPQNRVCPACGGNGATNFENNIACCNTSAWACNSATQSGDSENDVEPASWTADLSLNPIGTPGPLTNGLRCLIHQGSGGGQDSIDVTTTPFQFRAGSNNPLVNSNLISAGNVITTSDSIITFPIYDGATLPSGLNPSINVLGFMQVYVTFEDNGSGKFLGWILNIAGCGSGRALKTPIYGGGLSPVPVRLIRQ